MAVTVTYKPWDSNFFGLKTGEIYYTGASYNFKTVLQELKTDGYQLLYWKVLPTETENIETAKALSIFQGDIKVEFQFNAKLQKLNPNFSIQLWKGNITNAVIELGIESGRYSRFKNDPLLPSGSFERMYTEWVKQSIHGSMGNELYFIGDEDHVKGFITLSYLKTHAEIGLIAVDRKNRKNGIGTSLIEWAINKTAELNLNKLTVVTQQQNISACKLYEKCGGDIFKREYIYHIHL